jgi:hypothetical protein
MLKPYKNQYVLLILLTAVISAIQLYFTAEEINLVVVLNPFLSQLLGPLIIATFFTLVFWYTGRRVTPKMIFQTYLIAWIIVVFVSTYLLIQYNK